MHLHKRLTSVRATGAFTARSKRPRASADVDVGEQVGKGGRAVAILDKVDGAVRSGMAIRQLSKR